MRVTRLTAIAQAKRQAARTATFSDELTTAAAEVITTAEGEQIYMTVSYS